MDHQELLPMCFCWHVLRSWRCKNQKQLKDGVRSSNYELPRGEMELMPARQHEHPPETFGFLQQALRHGDVEIKSQTLPKNVPTADDAPWGMLQDALQGTLKDAWEYSINGIEGHLAKHVIAIGPEKQLMKDGFFRGRNAWWQPDVPGHMNKYGNKDLFIELTQHFPYHQWP